MRITQNVKNNQLLVNLNKVNSERQKYYNQISTGKQLVKPSDNPTGTARVLQLNKMLKQSQSYQKNIDDARAFLTATEASLMAVNESIQEALIIGLKGANDTLGEEEREILANEVDYILDRVLSEANRQYDTKYLFGGTAIDQPPFELSDPDTVEMTNENAIDGFHLREILRDDEVQINFSGKDVFVEDNNTFEALINLRNGLRHNDVDEIQAAYEQLKDVSKQVTNFISKAGIRYDHIENVENTLVEFDLELQGLKSSLEDADIAEAAVNFESLDTIYQANLQFGARILNMSLLDYLA